MSVLLSAPDAIIARFDTCTFMRTLHRVRVASFSGLVKRLIIPTRIRYLLIARLARTHILWYYRSTTNVSQKIDGNDGASTPPATGTESLHMVQAGTDSEQKITPEPPAETFFRVGLAGSFPLSRRLVQSGCTHQELYSSACKKVTLLLPFLTNCSRFM